MSEPPPEVRDRLTAAFAMVQRTGATSAELRYQDDESPTVWIGIASFPEDCHEVAAALDPLRAMLRLCERLIDGGICKHCSRPTGFEPDEISTMPLNQQVCWYQWDPEMKTFRRGCE